MSNERIYQPLTKKDRERLEELKKLQASGHMMPKLHESLIGIPEDEFQIDWPGKDAKQTRMYSLPPELTSYAFNGIDAYAMALSRNRNISRAQLPDDRKVRIRET